MGGLDGEAAISEGAVDVAKGRGGVSVVEFRFIVDPNLRPQKGTCSWKDIAGDHHCVRAHTEAGVVEPAVGAANGRAGCLAELVPVSGKIARRGIVGHHNVHEAGTGRGSTVHFENDRHEAA